LIKKKKKKKNRKTKPKQINKELYGIMTHFLKNRIISAFTKEKVSPVKNSDFNLTLDDVPLERERLDPMNFALSLENNPLEFADTHSLSTFIFSIVYAFPHHDAFFMIYLSFYFPPLVPGNHPSFPRHVMKSASLAPSAISGDTAPSHVTSRGPGSDRVLRRECVLC